jgi:hypothetical protein
VVYDPGKTDPEMLIAVVAVSNIFEASLLPQQHPTGEDLRDPDKRDEKPSKNKNQKEQQKGNNGGI